MAIKERAFDTLLSDVHSPVSSFDHSYWYICPGSTMVVAESLKGEALPQCIASIGAFVFKGKVFVKVKVRDTDYVPVLLVLTVRGGTDEAHPVRHFYQLPALVVGVGNEDVPLYRGSCVWS